MRPIRILVVDDSAVIRRLLADVLSSEPEIEIAGTAGNGQLALEKLSEVRPDMVTLDIEMPGMDGLATLAEIRKRDARLPVIMFSTLTERGASATLEALARGASDYVTKPSQAGSPDEARERVRSELVPKIKSLCAVRTPVAAPTLRPRAASFRVRSRIEIVAIGTSTGGPNALGEVLPGIPSTFPVPIVVVQHMPAVFTRLLAERLAKLAKLDVREGVEGKSPQPGEVWVAPGDYHMTLVRKGTNIVIALNQDPPENCCRPAVDVMFRSVAQVYGANVLGVVLTGMGSDGTAGARAIREMGGEIFAQDQTSSVVWGMPGSVVAAQQADRICPLQSMAGEVVARVMSNRRTMSAQASPVL